MITAVSKAGLIIIFISLFACSRAPVNATHVVEIKSMKFTPQEIFVKKGDTVRWINSDMVVHDITELQERAWSSGPLKPDSSWATVINTSTDYFCSIHVVMKGKIVIR